MDDGVGEADVLAGELALEGLEVGYALLVAAVGPEPRGRSPGEAREGDVHVVGRPAHQPDGRLRDADQSAMATLQILLAAGDQVADVDRLAGLGVRHEAVVGVLVLPVEHLGEGLGRTGQRRMGRHVVHPLAAEPHLAAPAAQALEELLAGPRSHALPYSAAVPGPAPSARQTRSGVHGMSMWRTPRCADGIDHGVLHCRRRADRARLADALGPERVERRLRHHLDAARSSVARPPR